MSLKVLNRFLARTVLFSAFFTLIQLAPPQKAFALELNAGFGTSVNQVGNDYTVTQTTFLGVTTSPNFNLPESFKINYVLPSNNAIHITQNQGLNPAQVFGQISVNQGHVLLLSASGVVFGRNFQANLSPGANFYTVAPVGSVIFPDNNRVINAGSFDNFPLPTITKIETVPIITQPSTIPGLTEVRQAPDEEDNANAGRVLAYDQKNMNRAIEETKLLGFVDDTGLISIAPGVIPQAPSAQQAVMLLQVAE